MLIQLTLILNEQTAFLVFLIGLAVVIFRR